MDSDEEEAIETDPISRQIFRQKRRSELIARGPDELRCSTIPIMVSSFQQNPKDKIADL